MKKIIIFVFAFMFFVQSAYAIGDNKNKKANKNNTQEIEIKKPLVTSVKYDDILRKSQEHSYDLKIADFNILISKQGIKEARSEYFPKINLGATTEYTKNFRDGRESTVMSIGDSFINPYTRYQNVLGVNLSYNLFDFGVRRNTLNAAKEDVKSKSFELAEKFQDLTLNVTDTYAKLLMVDRQLGVYKQIYDLEEKNVEYTQRLYDAQVVSSTELDDAKISFGKVKNQINDLNKIKEETISWLSFYTGEEYDINNLKIADFESIDFDPFAPNDYTKSATWKKHEINISKKEFELKAAKRNNYPKVNVYSRYYLYGSDHASYGESFKDIKSSNWSVGGSISMPVFDGLKNSANIGKKKLELQQLYVERDKAIANLTTKLSVMRSNIISLNNQVDTSMDISKNIEKKLKSTHKLVSKKLATPIEENKVKIELLKEQTELIKNQTASKATVRCIEALTKEY